MSAFMSDRTPEERRYFGLQMVVYDILRAEDGGKLATPQMVDGFVDAILALDPKDGTQSGPSGELEEPKPSPLTTSTRPRIEGEAS